MKLAYLINQYPKVSHSFIRREIKALEKLAGPITRISVRRVNEPIIDPTDIEEQKHTRFMLDEGKLGLASALTRVASQDPVRFKDASQLAATLGMHSERGLVYHGAYLAEACLLKIWCEREGITHIHVHFGTNPATVAMLCHALGGPAFSMTVHGPEEFDTAHAIGLGEKIKRSTFVVGISSFTRSQLWRYTPHHMWNKIHVVHCGLDELFFEGAKPLKKNLKFVSIGRLCEQKGQALLLDAFGRLVNSYPNAHLTLVGDGPLRKGLEARIMGLGLGDLVHITGWVTSDEVRHYLDEAMVMVLPSFAEGLPVSIMESYARLRPVISTYVAGIPELMDASCGWLTPAGSVDGLVDAFDRALSASESELQGLAEAGAKRVLERHAIAKSVEHLAQLLGP